MPQQNLFRTSAAHILAILALAGTTLGQSTAAKSGETGDKMPAADATKAKDPVKEAASALDDFVHFVRIDRFDLAKAYGEALLKMLPKPLGTAEGAGAIKAKDFLRLLEDPAKLRGFEQAASQALRSPDLEPVAAKLMKAYSSSKLGLAREPDEITKNIQLLSGTQRNRLYGRERLAFAGEYAMPQVLAAFMKRSDAALSSELRQVMLDLGRQAILPLATALPALDPAGQEQVVEILGDIKYPTARPYIYDLATSTKSENVRQACMKAATKIDGSFDASLKVAELFANLAEAYYAESLSLTSFPSEDQQLLWSFDPGIGLVMTPIVTPVFHEAMAMRCCERALSVDNGNSGALSLWLASNFSREIDSPTGYANPVYSAERKDATFYAVAAGATPTRRVLARGLDTRDVPLARRAIASIEKTAGATTLADVDGRNALLEALRYPNRRVQYEAALALGVAQPAKAFDGADRVVPILGSAIRDASAKFAAVVAGNAEEAKSLENVARGLGYTVLPSGSSLSAIEPGLAEAPGLDLLITRLPLGSTESVIADARTSARLGAVPVLAVLDSDSIASLGTKYMRDDTVKFVRTGTAPDQQSEAIKQLVEASSGGPISADEAADYQNRSLAALRDLALSGNSTLNVTDATGPLVSSLNDARSPVRMPVAEVLSHLNDRRAQSALFESAMLASGDEMIVLVGKVTSSAKRFGNLLEERQVERLRSAATAAATKTGADNQATALAALVGALKLPNEKLIPLILSAKN
ncbi:MAG: hypothetical protein ACT4PL_14755 [Phycisphaerales bacterium]